MEGRYVGGERLILQEADEQEPFLIARGEDLVSIPRPGTIDFSSLSRDEIELLLSEMITLAWGVNPQGGPVGENCP